MNHFEEIDQELQAKYKLYVGVDPCDTRIKAFTRKEQIERYAKNYAFWLIEQNNANSIDENNLYLCQKLLVITNSANNMLKTIKKKFNKVDVELIMQRCKQLVALSAVSNLMQNYCFICNIITNDPITVKTLQQEFLICSQNCKQLLQDRLDKRVKCDDDIDYKQKLFRQGCENVYSVIKIPHCKICGDTINEIKLVTVNTNDGLVSKLCTDCFHIQNTLYA